MELLQNQNGDTEYFKKRNWNRNGNTKYLKNIELEPIQKL